jgi:hypothetical protein
MRSEAEVQAEIQIEAAKLGCWLLRNNSGACRSADGRLVRFGLGHVSAKQLTKSSDLIGIASVVVAPEMVGRRVGLFTAVEVKREGWSKPHGAREEHQKNFLDWVAARGGLSCFAADASALRRMLGA